MIRLRYLTLAVTLVLTGTAAGSQILSEEDAAAQKVPVNDQGSSIKPQAKRHFDKAMRAAGTEFYGAQTLCNSARPSALRIKLPSTVDMRGAGPTNAELMRAGKTIEQLEAEGKPVKLAPPPVRIFDNLYYLGVEDVTAWAVTTPDGIILIDALNNRRDWTDRMEPAMRAAGLDPAKIRYIIITHGHGDHFGGAAYLAERYKARVLMSGIDWNLAPRMVDKPWFDPPPARDMEIRDGDTLTLGGTTIRMFITPGHTRGTVSMLIPVTDRGRRHVAALWGGTGFNFPHVPERFTAYLQSAQRFRTIADRAGADVPLSPHADFDGAIRKIDRLVARGPRDPNPFVMGKGGVRRFLTAFEQCAAAYREQIS